MHDGRVHGVHDGGLVEEHAGSGGCASQEGGEGNLERNTLINIYSESIRRFFGWNQSIEKLVAI